MPARQLENDKVNVRMPDGLRARIKASAALNGRSLNNEIVVALLSQYPDATADAERAAAVIEHLLFAGDDLEQSTRAAMLESRLRQLKHNLKIEVSDDGAITFRAIA